MTRFYLSGPMSGLAEFNVPAFKAATETLRANGFAVVAPHELLDVGAQPWAQCLRADLVALVGCDALILLPGWPQSRGARLELTTALGLDMPIYYWDGTMLGDMNRRPS